MSEALRKAAQQAIATLIASTKYVEGCANARMVEGWGEHFDEMDRAIADLKAALAEPEQPEPYIYLDHDTGETWTVGAIEDGCRSVDGLIALYTAPPAQTTSECDYKAWYEEAMTASNEAGFVGMSAAETIRELDRMVATAPPAQTKRLASDESRLTPPRLTDDEVNKAVNEHFYEGMEPTGRHYGVFARAIESAVRKQFEVNDD